MNLIFLYVYGNDFRVWWIVDDVKFVRNEYFCLGFMVMKKLFDLVIKKIVEYLKNFFKSCVLKRVEFFFFVGGFVEFVLF